MRRVGYLSARVIHRCRKDKSKIYPGKYVYATSSNEYGFNRGTLVSVKKLLKETKWRGDGAGFIEAPFIEEVRDIIRKSLKIDVYYIPVIEENKLVYKIGIIDLIHFIRDYRGIVNVDETSFKE